MSMSFKASPDGTFGEILVNGQVVAKLPVTGNAVIPGLVGTVSQSGGVPTGAVVERGSNANGEYVRFADGTQICTRAFGALTIGTAAGNIFRSADTAWTFPAAFSSSAVSHSLGINWGGVFLASGTSLSATTGTFYLFSPTALTPVNGPMVTAIGRWF